METIAASKFKERCLYILDHITAGGIIITKHGKPVARLMPIESGFGDLIGKYKNRIKAKGDIFSTGLKWNAES